MHRGLYISAPESENRHSHMMQIFYRSLSRVLEQVYPEGRMSQHLDKMQIGDTLLFKGPRGRFEYEANMRHAIGTHPSLTLTLLQCRFQALCLPQVIAGGLGQWPPCV